MSNLNENFIEIAPDIWVGNKVDYINSNKSDQYKYICATNTKNINPYETTKQVKNVLYLDLILLSGAFRKILYFKGLLNQVLW